MWGLLVLHTLPHPAHLEIFPVMKHKLNGVDSSAITGVKDWGGGWLVEGVPGDI